ncbi:MAG: hypothetical protein WCD18_04720 [Thermosynechococcaceae cyanobacterium]
MGSETAKRAAIAAGRDWVSDHAATSWLIAHPLFALGVLAVAVFLLLGLLRAIAQLAETVWLKLLRSPLQLIRWIGHHLLSFFKGRRVPLLSFGLGDHSPKIIEGAESRQAQLAETLTRLEQLQQEQQQLLQDVKRLLAPSDSPKNF